VTRLDRQAVALAALARRMAGPGRVSGTHLLRLAELAARRAQRAGLRPEQLGDEDGCAAIEVVALVEGNEAPRLTAEWAFLLRLCRPKLKPAEPGNRRRVARVLP
jgi:hypothetical protein